MFVVPFTVACISMSFQREMSWIRSFLAGDNTCVKLKSPFLQQVKALPQLPCNGNVSKEIVERMLFGGTL